MVISALALDLAKFNANFDSKVGEQSSYLAERGATGRTEGAYRLSVG